MTWVTGTLAGVVARVALAMLLLLGACGGDDGDGDDVSLPTAPATTRVTADALPECDTIQVLLKPEARAAQRDDVAGVLDGIEGVAYELVEAEAEEEPSMFLVTAQSDRASAAVDSELSGHPAVVSVVFPEQLC